MVEKEKAIMERTWILLWLVKVCNGPNENGVGKGIDMMKRNEFSKTQLKMIILDEADK